MVMAINLVFRKLITWPMGDKMQVVMFDFKNSCDMLNMMGAIDGTHISIAKPSSVYSKDYFFHKTRGYNVVAQTMVDSQKRFMDVYVGLLRSVNDFCVLRKSKLYPRAIHKVSFTLLLGYRMESPPYLLGDKGYPLLPWLMTLHKEDGEIHLILELCYNCKHKRGRLVVENAFGILKQFFRELLKKTKLHIIIVPDMFSTCCLFHNSILGRKEVDVEELMQMIQIESMQDVHAQNFNGLHHGKENVHIQGQKLSKEQNHHNLEIYLIAQRH